MISIAPGDRQILAKPSLGLGGHGRAHMPMKGETRGYSRPLRTAAMTRGLRRPWNTAKTCNGVLSGAYAMRYSYTRTKRKGRVVSLGRRRPCWGNVTRERIRSKIAVTTRSAAPGPSSAM